MNLDPHTRPTLEDILGDRYPADGVAYRDGEGGFLYATADSDVNEDVWEAIDRDAFLEAVAEGDEIVAAVFREWDARFGDGPSPSPMNEYPDDPMTVSMQEPPEGSTAPTVVPRPEGMPVLAFGPDGQPLDPADA